ncbi:MAG TPA: hypothetical protein VH062_29370 [Polyangiaceae bacterium]|nr:hypothetical protein [Polyangiaceae bacterium]
MHDTFISAAIATLLMLSGCSRAPAGNESTSTPATSAVAAASASPPSIATVPGSATPTDAKSAVEHWNALHAKLDAKGLASVYADPVEFYGQRLPKERVLAMKTLQFERAKDYAQSLEDLRITTPAPGRARAEFTKRWTQGGKPGSTAAVLELVSTPDGFLVTKETDGPSEALKNGLKKPGSCEAAVIALVIATEPAKGLLETPMPPGSGVTMGLRIGGEPPEQPTYSVAVHEDHPDHLATMGWYDVDPKTGSMTDTTDDQPCKTDPALSRKVVEACK